METKTIQVAGTLHVGEFEYYLAIPKPVEKDSWQPDGSLRFLGTPKSVPYGTNTYSFLRHIVVSPCGWWIDYGSAGKEINVQVYEDKEYTTQTNSPETDYMVTDPENGMQYRFDALESYRD